MTKAVTKILLFAVLIVAAGPAVACVSCNKPLEAAIFNEDFYRRLFLIVMPFPFILFAAALIYNKFNQHNYAGIITKLGPPSAAGFLIGVGMGGFVDGIVFHQMMQWHEFYSADTPPITLLNKQINNFWDGTFHAFTWLMTAVGICLLWKSFFLKDIAFSTKIFLGSIIGGWGIFNAFDAIVFHYILRLHNVREIIPNPDFYNHIYTAFSLLLLLAGFILIRSGKSKLTVFDRK